MASINDVTLLGNLGADPELRFTQNGTAVATLSVATSRSFKREGSDEYEEVVQWHRVVVWAKAAEWVADNKRKGDQVLIKGHLQTRSYEHKDEKTGEVSMRYATEVVARAWDSFGGVFALYGEKPRAGQKHPTPTDADAPRAKSLQRNSYVAKNTGAPGTVGGPKTTGAPSFTGDDYIPTNPNPGPGDDEIPF